MPSRAQFVAHDARHVPHGRFRRRIRARACRPVCARRRCRRKRPVRCVCRNAGNASRVNASGTITCVSICSRSASSLCCEIGPTATPPALLTSTSRRPKRSSVASHDPFRRTRRAQVERQASRACRVAPDEPGSKFVESLGAPSDAEDVPARAHGAFGQRPTDARRRSRDDRDAALLHAALAPRAVTDVFGVGALDRRPAGPRRTRSSATSGGGRGDVTRAVRVRRRPARARPVSRCRRRARCRTSIRAAHDRTAACRQAARA